MGGACQEALRVGFDRVIKLEFRGAKVSSEADLFPFGDLDEAAQLTESSAAGPVCPAIASMPTRFACNYTSWHTTSATS
jgi:hypothetical protein